jgi:hypothetical protein
VSVQKPYSCTYFKKELGKINNNLDQYILDFSIDLDIPQNLKTPGIIIYEFFVSEDNEQREYVVVQVLTMESSVNRNSGSHLCDYQAKYRKMQY